MPSRKGRRGKRAGGQAVLAGHKRAGKRFIPPFLQYVNMRLLNWHAEVIPEVLWIALVVQMHGFRDGIELCLKLATAVAEATPDAKSAFGIASEYSAVSEHQWLNVISKLDANGSMIGIRKALTPLAIHYPDFPIRLGFEWDESTTDSIKRAIKSSFDRRSRFAMLVQATVVYLMLVSGRLKVHSESALANFAAIESYPDTDESRKVASHLRATMNASLVAKETPAVWPVYFWDRGRELERCE